VNFDTLLAQGFASLPLPDAPFAHGGFPTPSGRCEFLNPQLVAQGLDGLPQHLPNRELPDPHGPWPLAMISPPARNFLNSTFVNVNSLSKLETEPLLEIHPDDAAARQIRHGDVVRVFIFPPSMEELRARLTNRNTDSAEVIDARMARAANEVSHWDGYDYVLVNDDVEECFRGVKTILAAERLKRSRQTGLIGFIRKLTRVAEKH